MKLPRTNKRTLWEVSKGSLVPHDHASRDMLRSDRFRVGDVVSVEIRKSRNPRFHRLAHGLGSLIAENIEAFSGLESHAVLKRIQLEGNVGCDEIALNFPGVGPCTYRIPRSLSFASMDEAAFHEVMQGMCKHIKDNYWPNMKPEQIAAMAELWVEAQ